MAGWITELNGISVALMMGVVNSGLAVLLAFGLNLDQTQQGTITAFVNALLVMVAAVAHSNAKRTKTVIPAPPIDESGDPPDGGTPPPAA